MFLLKQLNIDALEYPALWAKIRTLFEEVSIYPSTTQYWTNQLLRIVLPRSNGLLFTASLLIVFNLCANDTGTGTVEAMVVATILSGLRSYRITVRLFMPSRCKTAHPLIQTQSNEACKTNVCSALSEKAKGKGKSWERERKFIESDIPYFCETMSWRKRVQFKRNEPDITTYYTTTASSSSSSAADMCGCVCNHMRHRNCFIW